ncbi:oligosaccharide flippase family protein [Aurantivibrio infirmus]
MENFRNKVISGFAWEASARLIVQIASWISTFWVAHILVQEDYGIVGVSGIFTGLCLQIAGMGLYKALINKKILESYDLANIFWLSNLLSVVIYLVLYATAPVIASLYKLPDLELIIRVAGLMVILSSLGLVPHAILMRKLQFRATALISIGSNFIIIALVLILAHRGWGFWSLIISTVAGEAFTAIAFFVVVRYVPGRPKQLSSVIPMFSYGSKLLSAGLVSFASNQLAVVIASGYLGIAAVGSYQMAHMLAAIPMTKIGELFHKIGFPAFSQIQDDLGRTKSVFLRMHRILFMITAPMFAGIALTADLIIPIMLGEKWVTIVGPIRILCVLNIFMVSAQLIPRVLEGVGNSTAGLVYQGILLATGTVSMLIGVQWGLNWMLIGWAITFPIGYIYLLKVLFSTLNMTFLEFLESIKITLLCTLAMVLVLLLSNDFFYALQLMEIEMRLPSWVSSLNKNWESLFLPMLLVALLLKMAAGAITFCLCYLVWAKQHLQELTGLLRRT